MSSELFEAGDLHEENDNMDYGVQEEVNNPVEEEMVQEAPSEHVHTGSVMDEAIKRIKSRSGNKRRRNDGDDTKGELALYCRKMLETATDAHLADIESIRKNQPATAKLHFVERFATEIRNKTRIGEFVEANLAEVLKQWLLPCEESPSLPPLTIRSKLIDALIESSDAVPPIDLADKGMGEPLIRLWGIEVDLVLREKIGALCMRYLNNVLDIKRDADFETNYNAATVASRLNQDNEKRGPTSRLYAMAPARTFVNDPFTKKVDKEAQKNLKVNQKVAINRRLRELKKKD